MNIPKIFHRDHCGVILCYLELGHTKYLRHETARTDEQEHGNLSQKCAKDGQTTSEVRMCVSLRMMNDACLIIRGPCNNMHTPFLACNQQSDTA